MITVTIDGKVVEGEEGDTILDVAKSADIYIPTLCNHPQLSPFGGCRMCLVKVEGMKTYVPACATPISDGMIVYTNIEELNRLKRDILELILSEHPSACIVCDDRDLCFKYHKEPTKAGAITGCRFCPNKDECELYKIAEYLGIKDIRFEIEYKNMPVKRDDPFIDRDYNLCVLCGRCVRVCDEIRGVGAIAFTKRSHISTVGTAFDKPLIESECIFCGACVDVCPTGAISEKMLKWGGKEDKITATTCILCPVGCSINVKSKWDKVINVSSSIESINKGELCVKGRFVIPPLAAHTDRIKYPMIRENDRLKPVSWKEAISFAAERMQKYIGNKTAFVVSPWLTNEAAYITQKFARSVMKTDNITIASNMLSSVMIPLIEALGYCGPKGTIEDIDKADTILIVGTDLNLSAPILLVPIYKAKRRGAKIIMIDRKAKKVPKYIDSYVSPENYAAFFSEVFMRLKEKVNTRYKNAAEIADEIVKSKKIVVIFGQDLRGEDGAVTLLYDMITLLEEGTIIPVWDGGNLQGVLDMGAISGLLPGQYCVTDLNAKEHIETLWGATLPESDWDDVKALYLTQPISDVPENIEFLVLQSIFKDNLTEKADIVFPDTTFTECSGTITNLERRVQSIKRCVKPYGMAIDSWEIIARIAKEMGSEKFDYKSTDDITSEIFRCIPGMKMGLYKKEGEIKSIDLSKTSIFKGTFPDGEITYGGSYIGSMVKDFDSIISKWGYKNE